MCVCVIRLRYRAPSGDKAALKREGAEQERPEVAEWTSEWHTGAAESWFLPVLATRFLRYKLCMPLRKASEKGGEWHCWFWATPACDISAFLPGTLKSSLRKDFPILRPSSLDRYSQKQFNAGFGIFSAHSRSIRALNAYNTEESSYF